MDLGSILLNLGIGIAFGFTLERSGFGDSRRLAAQFYLYDQTVLKVMFTAIVWCMLLLFWSCAMGWVDFSRIFVDPTFIWSAILGGLILGAGFMIGGYCPGTSMVATCTGKVDGMFFLGGILGGIVIFAEAENLFPYFYAYAGAKGRYTLFDWLGVDPGWVALAVVLMALGMFWGAEKLEKIFPGPYRKAEGGES